VNTRAILLAPSNDTGQRRLGQLQKLANKNQLVKFDLVDATESQDDIVANCTGADVIIAPNIESSNPICAAIPGLKLLQTFSAGTDQLDKGKLLNLGTRVANNGGANAVCVAEHAIWLMLTINHKFDQQIESVRAGKWSQDVTGPLTEFTTLVDKRVGIIGLGRIGSRVARRLRGWECEVVYHDLETFDADYEADAGARRVPLDELIATSDYVSLHVPLDRVTRAMYSDAEFKAMKPTAVLINTCRGPVVDEAAMTKALQAGEIWGAGMDVTEVEPTDPNNPLITMPNVVITPHQGARVIQSEWNADLNAVENAERIARGLEPYWVVDPV
jgi:phosphoglycerate dehydrogenase-like enzyme